MTNDETNRDHPITADMESESFRDAATILQQRDLLGEIWSITVGMANGGTIEAVFEEYEWDTEYTVAVGANRPRLDGFKDGIGIEHEAREQMNVRSHLLFSDAMFKQGDIDAVVFIIPSGNNASKRRTVNELEDAIFAQHHPLDVPVLVIEYVPPT